MKKTIHLIPYTCGAGAQISGCVGGPAALKRYGFEKDLSTSVRDLQWQEDPIAAYEQVKSIYENLPATGSKERAHIVAQQCRRISDEVEKAVKQNVMPFTVGGDHSMAAGSIAGFARAKNAHGRIGLVWLDAHTDINTPKTSPSQALHGMPVAALLGLRAVSASFSKIGGGPHVINPEHIVYGGLRSVDAMEKVRVRKHHITAFGMEAMKTEAGSKDFLEAVAKIVNETDYLVVSFDIDVIDPGVAPSVGSPEEGGFEREQILPLLERLVALRSPDMVEMTEFNPDVGNADQTYAIIRDLADILLR